MKIFGREPALIIAVLSAGLSLLVTFNIGMSGEQAGAIVAVISGAFAAVAAAMTRPIAPSAFTGVVAAGAVLGLLTRGQVSPTVTPVKPA